MGSLDSNPIACMEPETLLAQMSLDEKISLLAGKNSWETNAIERLGIPSLKLTDGPNGARGAEFLNGVTAACFPACVSLASTFNRKLSQRIGKALAAEAQTKGAYVLLGPTVCPHRSPLGGRNFESFSEDPLLAGAMAAGYVKGLQSRRVAATVKHFLANEQETRRFVVDETISERALREIYMKPFEIVIKKADPWAIMTSYNKVNGAHVDAQEKYLIDVLRKEWKYDGLVMSDWTAVSTVESTKYGLDLEMPGPPKHRTLDNVKSAIKQGQIREQHVNDGALQVLRLLQRTGKFTDRRTTPAEQAVNLPEHQALIREAGAEGVVLLKNENSILPLQLPAGCKKKVAVMGPLAKVAAAHGGGSASLNCHYKINPYDALEAHLPADVELTYAQGAHLFRVYPDMETDVTNRNNKPGFTVDYFKNTSLQGEPFFTEDVPRGLGMSVINEKAAGAQAARVTGTYKPFTSGKHYLSVSGSGPTKLLIDGQLLCHQETHMPDAEGIFNGAQQELTTQHAFQADTEYQITVETIISPVPNSDLPLIRGTVAFHLGFIDQATMEANLISAAVTAARASDYALIFVGNTSQWETEGLDMSTMALPARGSQDALITAVSAANPNTIVICTTGVAIETPWIDHIPAFIQAWYAGQEAGNAIVDILLGHVNPSGKLPISWPKRHEDVACHGHFGRDAGVSKHVDYVEGVYVGYRHFDRVVDPEKKARFPFGYGLSYTSFDICNAAVSGDVLCDGGVRVTACVKNTGARSGAETVQVYIVPPVTEGVDRPVKELVGFDKVFLEKGEDKEVEVLFGREEVAYWAEEKKRWAVVKGRYEVLVATSSGGGDVRERLVMEVGEAVEFGP